MPQIEDKYIIAVKREFRDQVPADWRSTVASISGIHMLGASNAMPAIQIIATPSVAAKVRQELGDRFNVEKAVQHQY